MVKGLAVAAIGLGLLVAGCGGAPSTGPPRGKATPQPSSSPASGTLSVNAAAAAYLADVAPTNVAITAFQTASSSWTTSTTDAQAEATAQPLISALSTLETKLETTDWPATAQADVKTMTTDVAALNASLETLSTLNFLDEGTWLQGYTTAAGALGVAVGEVRHDLGLPPGS